jgi:hypothetical protein
MLAAWGGGRPDAGSAAGEGTIAQARDCLEHDPDPKGRAAQSVKRFSEKIMLKQ